MRLDGRFEVCQNFPEPSQMHSQFVFIVCIRDQIQDRSWLNPSDGSYFLRDFQSMAFKSELETSVRVRISRIANALLEFVD